jgi:aspartyl protease family protein
MAANSLWIVLALVLVGSSLALRRLPKGKLLAILLVWVAIFGIAWLGILLVTGQG